MSVQAPIVPMRHAGKVAIVTGAANGIGRECALRLAAEGGAVVVADIDGTGASRVAGEIREAGGTGIGVTADVSNDSSVAELIGAAVETYGQLNILHNNAALVSAAQTDLDTTVADIDLDVFDRTLAVNLRGAFLGCRYAIPHMIAAGGGSIINTSSGAAIRGGHRLTAYGASKGALNTLTLYVAKQYGKVGVRCNAIMPGVIVKPKFSDEFLKRSLRGVMTPYLGSPEDVASLVSFLASDESRFVTGQLINVDGGYSAH